MSQESQKNNNAMVIIAVIGVIGTICAAIIGLAGNYIVEKLRQETELTRIAPVATVPQNIPSDLPTQLPNDTPIASPIASTEIIISSPTDTPTLTPTDTPTITPTLTFTITPSLTFTVTPVRNSSILFLVYWDRDNNGLHDSSDFVLSAVPELYEGSSCSGQVLPPAIKFLGYKFVNLAAGTYCVKIINNSVEDVGTCALKPRNNKNEKVYQINKNQDYEDLSLGFPYVCK